MSTTLAPILSAYPTVIITIAGLAALTILALAITARGAQGVIDDAPYVITDPGQHAACVARHPSQVRTYWACCGREDCICGTGLGDVVEAWLAGVHERPYDHEKDGL